MMNCVRSVLRCYCCNMKYRYMSSSARIVLGIETSCDDTGAAVMDENGNILGEALNSQMLKHLEIGGIIPPLARALHKANIETVVKEAMTMSGKTYQDISAVATTVKPGLAASLGVGLEFTKRLVSEINKPFIPIHHMEAHALTARAISRVDFPYLVLLASGGHCQIAVVKDVSQFYLLGYTLDDAPGEAFDKIARRMKLRNLPECSKMCGGAAIEFCAKEGNPIAHPFAHPLSRYRDCNFSFSGLKFLAFYEIWNQEKKYDIMGDGIIPGYRDLCASFQHSIARHLARRLQRAMVYCERRELLPESGPKVLVASGGVLCNQYIRRVLQQLCVANEYSLVCPPPKLCTDNGIMIAWNGIERLRAGIGIVDDIESVDVEGRCQLGLDLSSEVRNESIKLARFKISVEEAIQNDPHTHSCVLQQK